MNDLLSVAELDDVHLKCDWWAFRSADGVWEGLGGSHRFTLPSHVTLNAEGEGAGEILRRGTEAVLIDALETVGAKLRQGCALTFV